VGHKLLLVISHHHHPLAYQVLAYLNGGIMMQVTNHLDPPLLTASYQPMSCREHQLAVLQQVISHHHQPLAHQVLAYLNRKIMMQVTNHLDPW